MFTCALKGCTSRSVRRAISSFCCLSNSRLASSLVLKSHVVHEEVSHFLLQVLHLVLRFSHLGLQLSSCANLAALRWSACLFKLYM